jgi:hypothetical protein
MVSVLETKELPLTISGSYPYCDITRESRNSPLLDNGSLTHFYMEMRIRGDRLGTVRAFHINGINKGSMVSCKQYIFSMDTR